METEKRKFFYSNYSAIENEIINGADKFKHQADKAESAKKLFHQQIDGVPSEWILEYVEYIKTQEIRDVWKREGLSQLKRYLSSIESKIILFSPITPPPKVTAPLHFTRLFTPDQLKLLYTGLTTGGFLPTDPTGVDLKAFCYILGDGEQEDFKHLNWIGFIKDLNAFINTFYNSERAKWKKTTSCFKWENNLINQNSLKTANDAYDKDPPSEEYFKILKKKIQ